MPSKRTSEAPRLLRMASPFYAQEALRSVAVYGGVSFHRGRTMARSITKFLSVIAILGCAIGAWNYFTLQYRAGQVLSGDPRNEGIKVFAHYGWFVDPTVLVFDLRQVSGENSPLDVTRTLLQFARTQQDRKFERVVLSYKGGRKFQLEGDYFHTLGSDHEHQNPVYTLRTLPENVYQLDGSPAFGTWTGGLLGVVGKQMNEICGTPIPIAARPALRAIRVRLP